MLWHARVLRILVGKVEGVIACSVWGGTADIVNQLGGVRVTYRCVAHSCNHYYSGSATVWYLCVVELHANCHRHNNIVCCATMRLWRIYVAGNSGTCLCLHVDCPELLNFWVNRQRIVVISYRIGPILRGFFGSWTLRMGPTGFPETSVRNYHY